MLFDEGSTPRICYVSSASTRHLRHEWYHICLSSSGRPGQLYKGTPPPRVHIWFGCKVPALVENFQGSPWQPDSQRVYKRDNWLSLFRLKYVIQTHAVENRICVWQSEKVILEYVKYFRQQYACGSWTFSACWFKLFVLEFSSCNACTNMQCA